MTVNELIEELRKYPGDMHIIWADTSMNNGYLNFKEPEVLMRYISFDPDKKEYEDPCFALQTKKDRAWERLKVMTIE